MASLGAKSAPSFLIDYRTLQYAQRRLRQRPGPDSGGRVLATRLSEVMDHWQWIQLRSGEYATKQGILDITRDGQNAIEKCCEESWLHMYAQFDNRFAPDVAAGRLADKRPFLDTHVLFASAKSSRFRRAGLGASLDERATTGITKRQRTIVCQCGELQPRRRHWLNECPRVNRAEDWPKASECEHALGVPLVKRKPAARARDDGTVVPPALVQAVADEAAFHGGTCFAATDGSVSANQTDARLGSWAIQLRGGYRLAGSVGGIDQSSTASELAAAVQLLRTAAIAKVQLRLLVDNKGVQQGVNDSMRGVPVRRRFCFGMWNQVCCLSRLLLTGSQCVWIPSHDKRTEWRLPAGFGISSQEARAMNKGADEAAGAFGARDFYSQHRQYLADLQLSRQRASWALKTIAQCENVNLLANTSPLD